MAAKKQAESSFLTGVMILAASLVIAFTVLYHDSGADLLSEETTDQLRQEMEDKYRAEVAQRRTSRLNARSSSPVSEPVNFPPVAPPKKKKVEKKAEGYTVTTRDMIRDAIDLIDTGKPHEALKILMAVLKKEPNNEQALIEVGMTYLIDFKKPEEAKGFMQKALKVNPSNRVVLSELVGIYEEQGTMEEGVAFFKSLMKGTPKDAQLSYGVGQMYISMGRQREAIAYLESAAANPAYADVVLPDLADAFSRSGQSAAAISTYKRAITQQEERLEELSAAGAPTELTEEKIQMLKVDIVRELIRARKFNEAEDMIAELRDAMPGSEIVGRLSKNLQRKRSAG